ncbi:MAG: cytochrome-c peroxidase [Bacteroidia bacterium]
MTSCLLLACGRDDKLVPAEPWALPAHFPAPVYDFSQNPTSAAGFELGKALFYDPITSIDSSISCASCHFQSHAFSDVVALSQGVNGQLGLRNAPALQNLAWMPHFNADGGINQLDLQPIAPLTDTLEHAFELRALFSRLEAHPLYPARFEAAFGRRQISDRPLLLAISQFTSRLISADSKYDRVKQGKASYTAAEAAGYALFQQHCASCHAEPLFSDYSFRNNGHLSRMGDEGRARVTGKPADEGKFRVPSLRNIQLSAPYMHDGSLQSLDEVLLHYAAVGPGADTLLGQGISLSSADRAALKAFLHSLTDYHFIANEAFSAP